MWVFLVQGGEAAEDGIPMPVRSEPRTGSWCSPPARPGHGREDGQLITCEVEAVPGRRQGSLSRMKAKLQPSPDLSAVCPKLQACFPDLPSLT